jgi:hypothetical protein
VLVICETSLKLEHTILSILLFTGAENTAKTNNEQTDIIFQTEQGVLVAEH